ncbi:uncharacterized protein LOC119792381 isoform X2 [Cyprinodon tularosa]|uniref:uncharacterized protein LOC119792381 isoform X2 n=1 Tax=Cyprinodon tularosa TaxID=77115 RepID=UPI0018E28FA1|nr:uncharacterized protein LOC119792381 isoform X2 [Cyprinodon tularosa]
MSVSNISDPLMDLETEIQKQKINLELQQLDDLLVELKKNHQVPMKIPEPTVRWRKRDKDGNKLYKRARSTRNQLPKTSHSEKTRCPSHPSNIQCEAAFAPETVEFQSSLNDAAGQPLVPNVPLASTNWSTRKSIFSESWKAERPRLVNTLAAQHSVSAPFCQQCGKNPSALRCRDCLPHPFFCEKCDVMMHTRHVFHNRETIIAGFFQPLPPTTYVLNTTLCNDARFVPVEIPVRICDCPSECLRTKPGKAVTVVTINGRYDLSMPELGCEGCEASWTCGVHDLNLTEYWPATLHFSTLYATDVLFTFEEKKIAAPGLSCQAFLKMLDQRTIRFGRTGKISADSFLKSFFEWEAVRHELDKMLKKDPFKCQAGTPDMLALSVDGNHKHHRFKNAAGSEPAERELTIKRSSEEETQQSVCSPAEDSQSETDNRS